MYAMQLPPFTHGVDSHSSMSMAQFSRRLLLLIDNVAYVMGLSERRRTRFEERGRVRLNDDEADFLAVLD